MSLYPCTKLPILLYIYIYFILRCLMLFNKKNILSNVPKILILFVYFLISTILILPWWFTIDIVQTNEADSYTWTRSEYGQSTIAKVYVILVFIVESIIPCFCLLILFVIAKFKFNKVIKNSSSMLASDPASLVSLEMRFSRFTLIIMSIFLFTHILDLFVGIANRLVFVIGMDVTSELASLINFTRQFTYLVIFSSHALNSLLYYIMDRNLRDLLPNRYLYVKKFFFSKISP